MAATHDLMIGSLGAIPVLYLPVLFEYAKAGSRSEGHTVGGRHCAPSSERSSRDTDASFTGSPIALIVYGVAFAWGELFSAVGVLQDDAVEAWVIAVVLSSMTLGVALGMAAFVEVQLGRISVLSRPTTASASLRAAASGLLVGLVIFIPALQLAQAVGRDRHVPVPFSWLYPAAMTAGFAILAAVRVAVVMSWRRRQVDGTEREERQYAQRDSRNNDEDPHQIVSFG